MSYRFVPTALLVGNFVIGTSVVAPAGILNELSSDLDVSIRVASYLIAFGSAVLCIGSPAMSWLTEQSRPPAGDGRGRCCWSRVTHIASAFVTSFESLLAIRMVMLLAAAFFTPQAASLAGVVAPPEKRASTVAYVFIGWSLALALGVPLMTAIASRYGWQASYLTIGAIGAAVLRVPMLCAAGAFHDAAGRSEGLVAAVSLAADPDAARDHRDLRLRDSSWC